MSINYFVISNKSKTRDRRQSALSSQTLAGIQIIGKVQANMTICHDNSNRRHAPISRPDGAREHCVTSFLLCLAGEVKMAYQFEFFRRTRDVPAGKTVRRETTDFDDLQTARAYCIAELQHTAPVEEMDGCRIYRDGLYEATVSFHSES
jgi:hypothetical protein